MIHQYSPGAGSASRATTLGWRYGGAYAYGKTTSGMGYGAGGVGTRTKRKARAEWLALMPHAHDGYVSWEKAEAIRTMVSSNVPTSRHHGAPNMATPCSPASFAAVAAGVS